MAFRYADRVKVANSAPGTGSFNGGATVPQGFQAFSAIPSIATGDTVPYTASDGAGNWETGYATYNATGTLLQRSAAEVTAGSAGAGTLVNFANPVTVWCDAHAATLPLQDQNGAMNVAAGHSFNGSGLTGNGYAKLPGGLILQWGNVGLGGSSSISLPITFPNACMAVFATAQESVGAGGANVYANAYPNNASSIGATTTSTSYEVSWGAIGY